MMLAGLPTNSQYHWLVKLFTTIKRDQPERIDKGYIRNIIADNHELSLLKLAKFLGVADDNGDRGPNYDKLNNYGSESFQQNLRTIIKVKYSRIFDIVDPLSADKERILKVIISTYEVDVDVAGRIVNVLVQLCRLADIHLSFMPTSAKSMRMNVHGQASAKIIGTKPVSKMVISEEAKALLDLIPPDGSSIGNTYLQTISKTGEDYRKIREELLQANLIEKGKGRGGSVSRTQSVLSTPLEAFIRKTADFVKEEKELYEPLKKWLEEDWGKEVEDVGDYYRVRITASAMGRKRNSGQWTRPDVTYVTTTKYDYLPSTIVEVTSFEVKRHADTKDLASVYEAAAHSRSAHNTYLVVEIANNEKVDDNMQKECNRLGVGLLTVNKNHSKHVFAEIIEPRRQEPAAEKLDDLLKFFFSDNEREQKQFKIRIK